MPLEINVHRPDNITHMVNTQCSSIKLWMHAGGYKAQKKQRSETEAEE